MELFVLMGEWHYESHRVLGVYSSHEEAVNAQGVYIRGETCEFNDYYIERRVLNAPVDDSFNGDYI